MKVFWSRCGHGHGNFGDKLTPLLLKHAKIPVEWAPPEHAELIGVGSILEKVPASFRGMIWTTGFMNESSRLEMLHARVLALRGRLTHQRVLCADHNSVVLGDAGLLCSDLAPLSRKRVLLGVVPHFVDIDDPFVKALANSSSEVRVIDICADTFDVMRSVAECHHVISSSLHGLILADSLGIPNHWLELNHGVETVTGAGFKYRDYYAAFGLAAPAPIQLTASTTLVQVVESIEPLHRPNLESVQGELRRSLTAIKEGVQPLTPEQIEARRDAASLWNSRAAELRRLVRELIPQGATVVIADDEQVRSSLSEIRTIPFTERDGRYWGPPATASDALSALQGQLERGATWVIVAWPMEWIMDAFPLFGEFLRRNLECRHSSEVAQFFELPRP